MGTQHCVGSLSAWGPLQLELGFLFLQDTCFCKCTDAYISHKPWGRHMATPLTKKEIGSSRNPCSQVNLWCGGMENDYFHCLLTGGYLAVLFLELLNLAILASEVHS